MEWIKVTDRLPEEFQPVLVTLVSEDVNKKRWVDPDHVVFRHGKFMWWDDSRNEWIVETNEVTHWMPYPAPAED